MQVGQYSDIYNEDKELRPYQQKAKREIFESWDEVDNVMFQMPTGTGKTRLFTSIISDINRYSIKIREAVKILIIAHRTELIDQISDNLARYKVSHNIMAGGKEKYRDPSSMKAEGKERYYVIPQNSVRAKGRRYKFPVIVASIQTITNARNLERASKLNVQFIIIDEAHHALAASYKKLWKMYPDAKRLGVTATPWRMNHQSFTSLFDKLILSMPIKDFIRQKYLAPYKYFSLRSDNDIRKTIDEIELDKFGEYKESSMEEKMDIGSIRAQLLQSYLSLAEGKKGIIYAINIAHAKHICNEYKEAGYNAVSIDSKTPSTEREDLVAKFKKGEIDIIVNVDIFSEGFDCPDIEFIQLARPTRSLVKYLQQVGRGLRPTENKQHCVILDNVGMYSRFGLPDARRHWTYHFLGKDVDEVPRRIGTGGNGSTRFVDLSEGTEDMELIQNDYEDVEIIGDSTSSIYDLFPLFGVTLGETTCGKAEELGGELKVDEDTGELYYDIENIKFSDLRTTGIISDFYWTKIDRDFPDSWKSKGFFWENSYDEWINVFRSSGCIIESEDKTKQMNSDGRITLNCQFEAKSQDGNLSFTMHFADGEKGYLTSSPGTLYSIYVHYHKLPMESRGNDSKEDEETEKEIFDPMPKLHENNYHDDNFVFWSEDNAEIYEAYIQDDAYFIISELIIDEFQHCVYRNRVGKNPMESWMFGQMNREIVENLKSITHFGANYTVFHYQVLQLDNTVKDKYYDYKGREIDNPNIVKAKYEEFISEGELRDFIDVPVSKATFEVDLLARTSSISIVRTIKGVSKPIAIFPLLSDFGRKYYGLDKQNIQVSKKNKISSENFKKLRDLKTVTCHVYRSDFKSFSVRCTEEDNGFIYNYDFKGKLLSKEAIAGGQDAKKMIITEDDVNKLMRAFDKKATSYKFFWFLSILKIYNDKKKKTISYNYILIKMVAIAWKYVFAEDVQFPTIDQLPNYLKTIQGKSYLDRNAKEKFVEETVQEHYHEWKWNTLLTPLLNNVPYRFLSPWIPFTNNEDVLAKSKKSEFRCPYSITKDHITINPLWSDYLIENYDKIIFFVEKELRTYLDCKK